MTTGELALPTGRNAPQAATLHGAAQPTRAHESGNTLLSDCHIADHPKPCSCSGGASQITQSRNYQWRSREIHGEREDTHGISMDIHGLYMTSAIERLTKLRVHFFPVFPLGVLCPQNSQNCSSTLRCKPPRTPKNQGLPALTTHQANHPNVQRRR